MAHRVRLDNTTLKIHQALHGYADGHRQLAASVQLEPRDIKLMLVLSDLSGPGTRIDDRGYLTGYPLPESRMYALARTWAAPEMPRPGCVWTHTLLIGFSELAELADPVSIASLFRRPDMSNIAGFASELSLSVGSPLDLDTYELDFARPLLAALYEEPHGRVIAARPPTLDVDSVVMAVWTQQWPRLRRAFRFCTASTADRSTDSNAFDLQLLPSLDRSVRSRFANAVEADVFASLKEEWLDDTVLDLAQADIGGLRTFLRRAGGDIESGREAFRSLCHLHRLVQVLNTSNESIDTVVSLLDGEFGPMQARNVRGVVATAAIERSGELDDQALDFLVRHLELAAPESVSTNSGSLGREIWRRRPDLFTKMYEGNHMERMVSESAFVALSIDELAEGIMKTPRLAIVALTHRPDLVGHTKFWSRDVVPVDAAFAVLSEFCELRQAGLKAMVAAKRDDLAARAAREIHLVELLQAIAGAFDNATNRENIGPWLATATSDPAKVAQFFVQGQTLSLPLLTAIAHVIPPDAVPNDYGEDPWLIAIRAWEGSVPRCEYLFLSSYLLSRALGQQSNNPGELAQSTFEAIHKAVSVGRLPEEAWAMLENRLPWSRSWMYWDRCAQIRRAVGDLFVERKLSPESFSRMADDDQVFAMTAETVAHRRRGRTFLKRVHGWLKDDGAQHNAARILIIEELIN